MKQIIFLLFFFTIGINAQDFSQNWKGHFSYLNITDLTEGDDRIFAAAENAIFIYNPFSQTTEILSSIQGISGEQISKIHYSEDYGLICVGYENGLVQIVMENNQNILSVVDILEKVSISPNQKRINHFYEYEGRLFISTDFGISEYDLANLEFNDSYFIGENGGQIEVKQTTVSNGRIYAATTQNGIRSANVNSPNLINFQSWQTDFVGNWKGILNFNDQIFTLRNDNRIFRINNSNLVQLTSFSSEVTGFNVSGGQLVISSSNLVQSYNSQLNLEAFVNNLLNEDLELNTAISNNNQIYLGHKNLGLLQFLNNGSDQFIPLSPDGPLFNRVFSLSAIPNELWVTYGEYSQFLNPYPGGINERGLSHLVGEDWINIPVEDLNNASELSDVAIDSSNPSRVFVSSYFDGLLEIENNTLIQQYDSSNSNIEGVPSNENDNRIGASAFDSQGNLYFSNSLTEHQIKRLNADGSFFTPDTSEGVTNPTQTLSAKLVVDRNNNVYLGTLKKGIIAYNSSTNSAAAIASSVQGVDFPDTFNENPNITALVFDQTSRLWIGTQAGLRVMSNPSGIFNEEPNVNVFPIIIEDVDGLPQELLFEQFITDIAVDGANNKWIATADSGVFQVSPNGQDILNIFNQNNSPLPTNSVRSVAVDQVSGRVYFGTTSGLLSYSSRITGTNENLDNLRAYPNPVRPNYTGLVTIDGLIDNANVKITDITGNLVYEDFVDGGTLEWDTRAFGRHKVASGVYLIIVTGEDQEETKVGKIMIIR
ncbi:type IX secretion system anionic LPS delivery protein PorZ [Psychroflexus aestuariivivens]|uniref:type IX secretion system anionic LPS delivery protein PorZ n=1 Tax=Psychroflexus aestuariivivens TaxID=1795040 RepID=UPI000FD85F16|nr:T9SS type A sorting domain-containing protein [Psychroflexus aestuariivivens]